MIVSSVSNRPIDIKHFRPMFEKHQWKSDILNKDTSLLKMSLFLRYFSNMLLEKTNYLVYP